MYSEKNLVYIFTILEVIEKIFEYTDKFKDYEEFYFANSQLNFNGTVNLLIAIGEDVKKIDENIKNDFLFEWKNIAKMRDKISHNYRGIDPYMVWDIVQNHLVKVKIILIKVLQNTENFKSSLDDVLDSIYYQHLHYLKEYIKDVS
ncbi:MAG: DUF86 domain-containing protein [Campylobacterales bacterium]|nr:DUF86 domain-containing protein [Campylobacterales bacterium]